MKLDRQALIIIAVVVIVLIIGAYLMYRAGKKSGDASKIKPKKDEVGAGNLTQEEYDSINALAVNLYNDMEGGNWNWEEQYYTQANELSNEALAVLSNVYNAKYEKETGETLLMFLQNENFWWNDYALQQKVDVLINRLVVVGAT